MDLYKKPGRRYELATNVEIVLSAIQILNATPGGKEVTDLFALKSMQGKLVIRGEQEEGYAYFCRYCAGAIKPGEAFMGAGTGTGQEFAHVRCWEEEERK